MTTATPRRRARLAALLLPLAVGAVQLSAACGGRRERLDVPQIALDVADQAPAPGGRIVGHVGASDATGLTLLAVYACTADSIFRQGVDLDRPRSAGFGFALYVASTATPGAAVEVYAVARDDQGFYTDTARTLSVGTAAAATAAAAAAGVVGVPVSPSPPGVRAGAAADEALCPHIIRGRRATRSPPMADAPTAPRP